MNDETTFATDPVDASGQPLDPTQVTLPEQTPMDDAAGGPDGDRADADADSDYEKPIDETSTDDLSVQGGA